MITAGIVNALIGITAALLTLLITFEYLERPHIQKRVRRTLWGVDTQYRVQHTDGRHGLITHDMVGGYVIVDWDDEPPTLTHICDIQPERQR